MTFLPIVQRELRLRSRKWTTYWLRAGAGMFTALLTMTFMLIAWIAQLMGAGAGSGKIGQALFITLAWLVFVFCLLEGARGTADCLSEEKREDTLGLLFLTDLRGYDVVLGKFVAASLNSFYGLIAVFPVLGVALVIGGVAPEQFWLMTLVLVNTLFFTTTTGMLVSAVSRKQTHAWAITLGIVMLTTIVPALASLLAPKAGAIGKVPGLEPLASFLTHPVFQALVETVGRFSPAMAFLEALSSGYGRLSASFWWTLLSGHLAGWAMLATASIALPYTWQEGDRERSPHRRWLRAGSPSPALLAQRIKRRARLLDQDAVLWLASRDQTSNRLPWLIVFLAFAGAALISAFGTWAFNVAVWWLMPFRILFEVWLALRICRFFVEARTSGALELLLTTPLTGRAIIAGQLRAAGDFFLAPLVGFTLVQAIFTMFTALSAGDATGMMVMGAFSAFSVLWSVAGFVACLFAICYTGMWLALVLKKPTQAFGLTLLGVFVLPNIVPCGGGIGVYLFFIFFPKYKLETDLRRLITGDSAPHSGTFPAPRPRQPPPLPIQPPPLKT